MDIMVEGPKTAQVAGMLHERDIPFAIAIGDVGLLIEKEQGNTLAKTIRSNSSGPRKIFSFIILISNNILSNLLSQIISLLLK